MPSTVARWRCSHAADDLRRPSTAFERLRRRQWERYISHRSKAVQPVPRTVYRSTCRDRHTCPRWDLIPESLSHTAVSHATTRILSFVCSASESKTKDSSVQQRSPVAVSASRSLRCSSLPVISTADTRTENLAPVRSFWSLISRNSQSMAHGMTPRDAAESSTPSIVYVLPAFSTYDRCITHLSVTTVTTAFVLRGCFSELTSGEAGSNLWNSTLFGCFSCFFVNQPTVSELKLENRFRAAASMRMPSPRTSTLCCDLDLWPPKSNQ